MHTFTFENQLFFNKTYEPNFNLSRDLANQFLKFHAIGELTRVPAKKICSFSKFFSLTILFLYGAIPVRWYVWLTEFSFKTNQSYARKLMILRTL